MNKNCIQCGTFFECKGGAAYTCSDECRFWSRVTKGSDGDCWRWDVPAGMGYGQFRSATGYTAAHIYSMRIHDVDIPDGYICRHLCNNKLCVRPGNGHVVVGTQYENCIDKSMAGKSGSQKLTVNDVVSIKEMIHAGSLQADIAALFGVSVGAVSGIKTGRTWAHLDGRMNSDKRSRIRWRQAAVGDKDHCSDGLSCGWFETVYRRDMSEYCDDTRGRGSS